MHTSKSAIHPETPNIVLKSIFQRYDTDNDGLLNENEFGNALEDLGINDETEQMALFALADSNNSKTVHFDDFLNLIKSNDFELILSSRADYEFVIDTFKIFQQYDENGDGQITWPEFYFYLTRHGYSHQYISQYWYYMDTQQTLTVSFEGFWKGFKVQANAIKQHQLQQQLNKQIIKNKKFHSKILNTPSIIDSRSWSSNDKNNIFRLVKTQLKPTKRNKSAHTIPLGRVLDNDPREEHKFCMPQILTDLPTARPSRLPDLMSNAMSPLNAIIPTFKIRTAGLTISLLSPIVAYRSPAPTKTSCSGLGINSQITDVFELSSTSFDDLRDVYGLHIPHLTPNYSVNSNVTVTPIHLQPFVTRFPSIGTGEEEEEDNDVNDGFTFLDNEQYRKRKRKSKRKRKREHKKKKLKLKRAQSERVGIDRTSVLRPRKKKSSKKCRLKIYQSACMELQ